MGAEDQHLLNSDQTALKHKELSQVEKAFIDIKSILETRPINHQRNEPLWVHCTFQFSGICIRKRGDEVGSEQKKGSAQSSQGRLMLLL